MTWKIHRRGLMRAATLAAGSLALPPHAQEAIAGARQRSFGIVDGEPVSAAQLRSIALVNYGHFTTLQIAGTSARGLDFQVARLQRSTHALFRTELDAHRIRAELRRAVEGNTGLVLARVNVFPTGLDWEDLGKKTPVALLVTFSPLAAPSHAPQRVCTVRYEREQPSIKHVGTFGLFHHRRAAQLRGFDDALFVDAQDSVTEGTTWNIGFHDGKQFVFPTAPALPGGAAHLLKSGMRLRGIPFVERDVKRSELPSFSAAFLTNIPAIYRPIVQIDQARFGFSQEMHATLRACYEENSLEQL